MAGIKALLAHPRSISRRTILSYVVDYLILILLVAGAAVFSLVSPSRGPFSIFDASIAYPYVKDTVSITTVGLVAIVAPAILIVVICLITVPGPVIKKTNPRLAQSWGYKLWEIFTGITGLLLSFALAFFVVQSTKNLLGKHRPDFLSRCNPDFNKVQEFAAGKFGNFDFDDVLLVTSQICRSNNGSGVGLDELDDGFRAFPSGHTTISFAGLVYLSLFLAAKFAATIPHFAPYPSLSQTGRENVSSGKGKDAVHTQAAAPPLYLLVLTLVPVGAAVYISGTRYNDHKHDGFTVLFSAILGTVIAWFAFRWYHAPVRRGAGWAWGPRSRERAFGIGLGVGTYSGPEGWRHKAGNEPLDASVDVERGIPENARRVPVQSRSEDHDFELSEFGPSPVIASDSSQRRLRSESMGNPR